MRTTLDIADDVLAAAKDLARAEGRSMGDVISELARKGLTTPQGYPTGMAEPQAELLADDWLTFPRREGLPVTSDLVRQIQDDLDMEDGQVFDHKRQAPQEATPKV